VLIPKRAVTDQKLLVRNLVTSNATEQLDADRDRALQDRLDDQKTSESELSVDFTVTRCVSEGLLRKNAAA
jgi:hypothetical protein